jgi:prepilin-type N-terminal cleavage/methylation domain-containing protein
MQLKRRQLAFSLTELAVVMVIVGLLLGAGMMTLSAQIEIRNTDETNRRLNAAVDALIGFAIANGRLPCPATAATTGDEAPAGGGNCTTWYGGFLPARTIGFTPVDSAGYGLDVWANPIRYAVANLLISPCTGGPPTLPHFTSAANLKANGVSCRPNDLDICQTSSGINTTSCNTAPRVASIQTVAFIVYSTGKNGAITSSYGADELANTDGDRVFVSRTQGSTDTGGGQFDDLMVIVPVGVLYAKLIAAGVLP